MNCQKERTEPILNNTLDEEILFIFEIDKEDFNHQIKMEGPEFAGGDKKLYNYVNAKLGNLGDKSIENREIEVQFEVSISGKVKNVNVLKAGEQSTLLKENIISIFQNMPKWKPGTYNSKIAGYKLIYNHQSRSMFLSALQ